VFDVRVPEIQAFDANGFLAHNCGEQPLLAYESCTLGSLNLARFVSGAPRRPAVDFARLAEATALAVRFLDDTIDATVYPLPAVDRMHKGNRKIGLGVMGWADMLILLGIPYNHPDAFALARTVMRSISVRAREASRELAEQRGVFPNFTGSIFDAPGMPRVRNATTTTIAPTGTLATIAGCSSGIEPLFAIAYKRLVLDTVLEEVSEEFVRTARARGFYSDELFGQVLRRGSLKGIKGIPADVRRLFVTALEIPPEDHIEMQAAFQEFTDNAVSLPDHHAMIEGRAAGMMTSKSNRGPRAPMFCPALIKRGGAFLMPLSVAVVIDRSAPITTTKTMADSLSPNQRSAKGSQHMLGRV